MGKIIIAVIDGCEITLRELLVSIIILFVMAAAGFMISEKLKSYLDEKNVEYEQAIKIADNRELFEYGMRTNVGNAFISGTLKTLDPVSLPEIDGEYSSITKTKEKYTKHTRTVTKTVNGKSHTETETYYTWDTVETENYHATKISFLDVQFDYGKIDFPTQTYLETIKVSHNIRYVYKVCGTEFYGTIYTRLADGNMSKASFYNGQSVTEALETVCNSNNVLLVVFWVVWIILTVGIVLGFVIHENEWIED